MAGITELGIVFRVAKGLFALSQHYKNYRTRFSSVYDVYYAVCSLKRWGVAFYPEYPIFGMVFDNYSVRIGKSEFNQAIAEIRLTYEHF